MSEFLKIEGVSKKYGDLEVLSDINLCIDKGEFIVLVGPSGSGKSTLLKIISGLEELDSGKIWLNGEKYSDLPPQKRNIAMVFQNYALFPHLNVFENMMYGTRVRNECIKTAKDNIMHTSEVLGINNLIDRLPGQLSGGQRQRVAMGRAMVRKPLLFLFDEPLSNLDAALRSQMRTEIKRIHQDLGGTFIYVTHDQHEAMTLADRLVIMKDGKIHQTGKPEYVYNHPKDQFIASFLASPQLNTWSCETVLEKDQIYFKINNTLKIKAPDKWKKLLKPANKYNLGVRPQHFKIGEENSSDSLPLCVEVVEPTGVMKYIHGKIYGEATTLMTFNQEPFTSGQKIKIKPILEHLFIFDPKTGKNIDETI